MNIMYLDEKKKRTVTKALSRHGKVFHAADINDALLLLVENDFDYYFVDADTPQSQSFLRHLEHDQHLVAPRAVVLLTDNEDEDCSAWRVDTFVTRGRIGEDLPYIFSHLRGETVGPANVLTIVTGDGAGERDAGGRLRAFEERPRGGCAGGSVQPPDPRRDAQRIGREDVESGAWLRGEETVRGRERPERKGPVTVDGRYRAGRFMLLAALSLVMALGGWGLVWGPLSADNARDHRGFEGAETVDAESPQVDAGPAAPESGKPGEVPDEVEALVEGETQGVRAGTTVDSAEVDRQAPVEATVAPVESPSPAPAVSENHAPVVSINGPSTVNQGQTVTYTASGSDPDGDPLTLSWTSRTVQFNTTDAVTLTVTVTDSRGASSTASKTIHVI